MKKTLVALILVLVGLAVLLPFASRNPDGLQKVVESFDAAAAPIWEGLLPNYSVGALGNGYLSTLIAGVLGVMVVVVATLVLGKLLVRNSRLKN